MPILTLSRQYGAGGLDVGRRLGELWQCDVLDSRLVAEVARRLRVSEEVATRWDERREGLILRLLSAMQGSHPEYLAPVGLPVEVVEEGAGAERVAAVMRDVVFEMAQGGKDAVIVGRGASFVLADRPEAWHVRLVAPKEARCRRVAERFALKPDEAERQVERLDRERLDWLKHHFVGDPENPVHYHLVINTERCGIDGAVRIITAALRPNS